MFSRLSLLLCAALGCTAAKGDEPTVGTRVFYKNGAKATADGKPVALRLIPFPATVTAVEGDNLWLGRAWVSKDDVLDATGALEYFSDLIKRDPTDALSYMSRSNVWAELGDLDEAMGDVNESIKLNPEESYSFMNRGHLWQRQREYDKAIDDYSEAIRLDPDNMMALNNRGNSWAAQGIWDKAVEDYKASLKVDPNYPTAINSLANILAICPDGRYRDGEEAVKYAKIGCELSRWGDANKIDSLAAAYAECGDYENAIKWQEKATELAHKWLKGEFRQRLELYKAGQPYRASEDDWR